MNRSISLLLMAGGGLCSVVVTILLWPRLKQLFHLSSERKPPLQGIQEPAENVFKKGKCGHFNHPYLRKKSKLYERLVKMFEREQYVRRHPVMNLLGFLAVMDNQDSKGIKWFKDVLQEDPTNVNAMLNLIFTYKALGKEEDADTYRRKLELLNSGDGHVHTASKARALYELAEALVITEAYFDVGEDVVRRYYQGVLEQSEKVAPFEQREWHFNFAFLCFKMHSREHDNCYFMDSMKNFYWVVSGNASPSFQSGELSSVGLSEEHIQTRMHDMTLKAWNFMGTLMCRDAGNKQLGEIVTDVRAEHKSFTMLECMDMAMELTEEKNMSVVLRRIGQVYTETGNMEKAHECLTEAVELEKENGYGFELLGVWYLKKYEQTKSQRYLADAIQQFEEGLRRNCDLWHIYRNYAKALFLNGDDVTALSACKKGEELGGDRDDKLYDLWADILGKSGESKGEAEKREMAKKIRNKDVPLFKDFIAINSGNDEVMVVEIVKQIQRHCQVSGWSLDSDMTPGRNVIDEGMTMQRNSKFVLVFVSEHLTASRHEQLFIKEIVYERSEPEKAKTIVPVLLPGATEKDVPNLLKSRKRIMYEESEMFFEKCDKLFQA